MKAKQYATECDTSFTREVSFNMEGLDARLDTYSGTLTLQLPSIQLNGPIITSEAITAFEAAGLSKREIEDEIDEMYSNLETKILAKVLANRRNR